MWIGASVNTVPRRWVDGRMKAADARGPGCPLVAGQQVWSASLVWPQLALSRAVPGRRDGGRRRCVGHDGSGAPEGEGATSTVSYFWGLRYVRSVCTQTIAKDRHRGKGEGGGEGKS